MTEVKILKTATHIVQDDVISFDTRGLRKRSGKPKQYQLMLNVEGMSYPLTNLQASDMLAYLNRTIIRDGDEDQPPLSTLDEPEAYMHQDGSVTAASDMDEGRIAGCTPLFKAAVARSLFKAAVARSLFDEIVGYYVKKPKSTSYFVLANEALDNEIQNGVPLYRAAPKEEHVSSFDDRPTLIRQVVAYAVPASDLSDDIYYRSAGIATTKERKLGKPLYYAAYENQEFIEQRELDARKPAAYLIPTDSGMQVATPDHLNDLFSKSELKKKIPLFTLARNIDVSSSHELPEKKKPRIEKGFPLVVYVRQHDVDADGAYMTAVADFEDVIEITDKLDESINIARYERIGCGVVSTSMHLDMDD